MSILEELTTILEKLTRPIVEVLENVGSITGEWFSDTFIPGFCKVEFLCYAGEPNWLGWVILFIFGGVLLLLFLYLLEGVEELFGERIMLLFLVGGGFLIYLFMLR